MKRILVMALVACFVLGAAIANAKEVTFQGSFEHTLEWTDNTNFLEMGDSANDGDNTSEDDFDALQRVRLYFNYVDSETLRGVVGFEMDTRWGQGGTGPYGGGQIGTDGESVELKHAYTDFQAGGVSFRVGLQGLSFPGAVAGSPILSQDVAGIVASYAINDNFALVGGWARLLDDGNLDTDQHDEIDAFTIIAPITMDGWSLTPYVIYAQVGEGTGADGTNSTLNSSPNFAAPNLSSALAVNASVPVGDDLDAWWVGAAFSLTAFDPIVFNADLIYGSVDGSNSSRNDREGWFFASSLAYKMDMVTPALAFVYGSGDDDDSTDGSEAMPSLIYNGATNGGFGLTTFGFDGARATTTGGLLLNTAGRYDFWAVGLLLNGFSLAENLTQDFKILYGCGTTDSDLIKNNTIAAGQRPMITDEDSFWEVTLDSSYQIYENLSLWSEIGYINVDLDEGVWEASNLKAAGDVSAASKFAIGISYNY